MNGRFTFGKTIKVRQKLRKDIIVDIPTLKKLSKDKNIII